jgi:signal transduction histidine kinase
MTSRIGALAAQDEITLPLESSSEPPRIEADEDRIEQVITHFLSNALKFSPAKGQVGVHRSADSSWVRCSVSDHGCGIE